LSLLSESSSNLHAESIVESNETVWTSPDDFDFNGIPADFPLVMDSQDWPDTSNAIVALPLYPHLPSEIDKFPELHEIQEL